MSASMTRDRLLTCLAVVVALSACFSLPAHAVTIDWVTVGNPGNVNDTINTGTNPNYGAVGYEYQIAKYDVTIQQYCDFLNAAAKSDPYSLYDTGMANNLNIAGISRSGTSGGYTYSVINNGGPSGNRPITYVSWFDAARFANWVQNGQGSGSTETGAYTLVGGQTSGTAPAKNAGATFYIPTVNEWYKAAYYSPNLNSGAGGYYKYATQSNTAPGNVVGGGANQANWYTGTGYSTTQFDNYFWSQNYLTDVGAFTNSASFYGTFDQTGNVHQWNDLDGSAGSSRGLSGGYWGEFDAFYLSSSGGYADDPSYGNSFVGFRLASPARAVININVTSGIQSQAQMGYPTITGTLPLIKTGAGTLVFDAANTYTGTTSVNAGMLLVTNSNALRASPIVVQTGGTLKLPSATRLVLSATSLTVDQATGGKVDVGKGRIEIAPGGIIESDLRDDLIAGRSADWSFSGTSGFMTTGGKASMTSANPVVGYRVLPSGTTVVAWAAYGDANLDGQVSIADITLINNGGRFNQGTAASWSQGDFNYDGKVTFTDIVLLNGASIYGTGSYLPVAGAAVVAPVPEPSTYALLLAGIACGAWQMRRRTKAA